MIVADDASMMVILIACGDSFCLLIFGIESGKATNHLETPIPNDCSICSV